MKQAIHLKDYTSPHYSINKVDLIFDIYEEYTLVTNTMQINKVSKNETTLKLDSIDLELQEIWLNQLKLSQDRYNYENEILSILNVPESFNLKIINKIYPHTNTELEGLYKSGSIFCTQNEPEGFRRITPYIDRPDVMSVFTTTVIADKQNYPILLSNGNKTQCHDTLETRHGVTWHDPHPKPSYLFALVAGDLGEVSDTFTTKSGNEVFLNIYCDLGNESKTLHAMKSLKKAMTWDEEKYAREYDLDYYNIVAVDSFNMGAMENKGLNIFNSHYVLADEASATDKNFMGIESVIAHEYFHNWTGNRITCKSWFELTLKEGLTVFRDQCFSADMNSKEVQRIEDVKALRQRQFVEDASPTAHPIQPKSYISMNNFYTSTVYEKGAEVIRMIHTLLGEKKYREATDLYFNTFDGQAVTIHDFLWSMSHLSGIDLTDFERWYHQSGTPTLIVKEEFSDNTLTLSIKQEIPNDVEGNKQQHYYFPFKIALFAQDGKELFEKTLIIKEENEIFTFENLNEQPIVSLNRDFSVPAIIKQKNHNYPFLMKYDTNSFVRYESAQNFALEVIQDMINKKEINPLFIESYGYLLNLDINLSYKALLLELPSTSSIMQRQEVVDFEIICKVKDELEKQLSLTYYNQILKLYNSLSSDTQDKRALKNRLLTLLSSSKKEEPTKLANHQYFHTTNMTDKLAALFILENSEEENKDALNDFYENNKNNTLVMNKYFNIIASSSKENLLEKVKKAQNDKAYDMKVPNLVRALLGTFTQNAKYFHAKDGSGYKFIADKIIELDSINPQIAANLCSSFKIYPKMNVVNKKSILKELNRVKSTHSLSINSLEILNKILENN